MWRCRSRSRAAPKAERLKRAAELLDLVGLSEKAKAYPAVAVGRPEAARRHRQGAGRAPGAAAVRRSDLGARSRDHALHPGAAEGHQPAARPDHPSDHPRDGGDPLDRRPRCGDRCRAHRRGRAGLVGVRRPALRNHPEACSAPSARNCRTRSRPGCRSRPAARRSCRVDVAGEAARGPLLSDLAAAVPGSFRLVHGGIDHVQQQPVGTLFLGVPGGDADISQRSPIF